MILSRTISSSGRFGYLRLARLVRGFRTGTSDSRQDGSLTVTYTQRPSGRCLPAGRCAVVRFG
jgi:hypothetical protein